MNLPKRIYFWVDERLEMHEILKKDVLDKPIPKGLNISYCFGGITFFLFVMLAVTGYFMTLYYVPSPEQAYDSVDYLTFEVPLGYVVRGVHHWSANLMIVTIFIHMIRVFVYGAYKNPREINWMTGVGLFCLVMAFGFTGYLLPWDQKAYWATKVGTSIMGTVPVVGDCKVSLQHLNRLIDEVDLGNLDEKRQKWFDQIDEWKNTKPLEYNQGKDRIKPQYVVEKLYELTKGQAIITTEVGQNQMWAAQYYRYDKPNHFITSGGLGAMGFGLPAAIGAQVAFPDKTVVDIAGDCSIQMNIQEMATAVQSCLPVKIVILNNGYMGMVRQWQELFYDKRYVCTTMDCAPDFVKLAEAYGAVGLRATKPEEVESVLAEGLSIPRPVIMEFIVEREEGVYPMVPAGAAITEMLLV